MSLQPVSRVAVLGAGSWGTALAAQLARNGLQVSLWGRDAEQLARVSQERENKRYLPGISLPDALQTEPDLGRCLSASDAVLIVTPCGVFTPMLEAIAVHAPGRPVLWACKGLDKASGELLHVRAEQVLASGTPTAIVSGPTFAAEVARDLPAALTAASFDEATAKRVASWFHGGSMRVYSSTDMIGVQLAGALKNVLAVAAGISDGLKFGANARAAMVTRGLVELTRLGVALGGQRETFMGLAGLGDLILTCTDDQSRNRRFGLALARGLTAEEAIAEIGQVVEGASTTKLALELARRHAVETPIVEQVYSVLYEGLSPQQAVQALMAREARAEVE
ncbi:MAG: NAD(P)H-dependent glycerol-3-phosphate dehydrogenase [Granulosicoccaceae bacterium]